MKELLKRLLCVKSLFILGILGSAALGGCSETHSRKSESLNTTGQAALLDAPKDFEKVSQQSYYCTEDKCYLK